MKLNDFWYKYLSCKLIATDTHFQTTSNNSNAARIDMFNSRFMQYIEWNVLKYHFFLISCIENNHIELTNQTYLYSNTEKIKKLSSH